jgi:hypothetical protein
MSSQFSYELDERQIRIMLQDGELENDHAAWSRFEQSALPDSKPKSGSFSPKFNLSISRSVIVPVIFVVLIGGLSATLFSFVDFKKKEVPVASTGPTTKASTNSVTKLSVTAASKVSASQSAVVAATNTSVNPAANGITEPKKQVVVASTPSVNAQQVVAVKKEEKNTVSKPEVKQPEIIAAKINAVVAASDTKNTVQPVLRKRKKKVASEEIPTINTSATSLNQESQEPELELK